LGFHPERDRDPFSRFCTAQPAIRVKDNDNNMKTIGRIFSNKILVAVIKRLIYTLQVERLCQEARRYLTKVMMSI